MNRLLVIAACFALSGCASTSGPAPVVEVSGPQFAASEFVCAPKPAAPDRRHNAARDTIKYIERQDLRGDDCAGRLASVGRKAAAAELVR
jgi:hypothetical protein